MKKLSLKALLFIASSTLITANLAMAGTITWPQYYMPKGCQKQIIRMCKILDANRSAIVGDLIHHMDLDKDIVEAAGKTSFEHECDGYKYKVTNTGGNNWVATPLPYEHPPSSY